MTKEGSHHVGLSEGGARITGDPIGRHLQEISRLIRQFEKKLGETLEVNPTDLAAMDQLMTHGPLTPSTLATRLGVTTAASTQIVDRLEQAGHVARERHDADRRKVLVVPAAESMKRAFAEMNPMFDALDALFTRLSASEREVIERFLAQLEEIHRAAAHRGVSDDES